MLGVGGSAGAAGADEEEDLVDRIGQRVAASAVMTAARCSEAGTDTDNGPSSRLGDGRFCQLSRGPDLPSHRVQILFR